MMASSKLPKRDKQELLNFSRAYNFTQLIKEPTRITDTSRTMIDLVFANNEHHIVKSGITTKAKPRILEYRSYKNFNPTLFNDDLRNIPWHIVENEDNVDDVNFHFVNGRCHFSERSLPFETVDAISQNGRCHWKRSMPFLRTVDAIVKVDAKKEPIFPTLSDDMRDNQSNA